MKPISVVELKPQFSSVLNNKKNSLDFYSGSWINDSEFDKIIKEFDSVDIENWKCNQPIIFHKFY